MFLTEITREAIIIFCCFIYAVCLFVIIFSIGKIMRGNTVRENKLLDYKVDLTLPLVIPIIQIFYFLRICKLQREIVNARTHPG